MTRFEMDLAGKFGEYWLNEANKELEKVRGELDRGEITIDAKGVARNRIGRVLMKDMAIKVYYAGGNIDLDETEKAREIEVEKELAEYRRNYKGPSAEELAEMRAAFGPGEVVVDLISGKEYRF